MKNLLKKMIVVSAILPAVLLLSCQSNSTKSNVEPTPTALATNNKVETKPQDSHSVVEKIEVDSEINHLPLDQAPDTTPLDRQSLQDLLLAEIAYQQRDYKTALDVYYELALRVNDPKIAEKAAKIAAYLSEDEILASMLKIWLAVYPNDQDALMLGLSNSLIMAQLDAFESRFRAIMLQKHDLDFLDLVNHLPVNIEAYDSLETLLVKLQNQYKQPQIYTLLAFVYEHKGEFEKSVQMAQKAIGQFDNPKVRMLLVNNYNVLGLQEQSDQMLESSFEKFSSNRALAEARIQLAWQNEEFALAYQLSRQMYERNPTDPNLAYQFARLALKQKDYVQAKQVFNSLLIYPSLENEMNYSLALIANEEQDFEQALRFFSKVKPSSYYQNSQYFRAKIIWQTTNDTNEVIKVFDQLISNVAVENQLTVALLEVDFWTNNVQFQTALDRFEQIVDVNDQDPDVQYQYALLLDSAGQSEQSINVLKSLLEGNPDNSNILNAYGYVLGNRTDQVELALTYVDRSLEIEPGNPAALDSKGWLLYKLNQFEQALPLLQEAFEKFPHDEVAAHLGAVLWQLGLFEDAEVVWQQGLEIQPDSVIIEETKQSLKVFKYP